MKGFMIQGTASDVGKSVLTTAFCRIFYRLGYKVTPFKSQNMSNNSYITIDGKEIGRAQGIQAEAANIEANVYMNPILLKPRSDQHAEVVLLGKSFNTYSGKGYRQSFYETGLKTIATSLRQLKKQANLLIIEGAGSPVEVNLNDRELVNMKIAELADVPVFLVADIDRGGVFASIVGTLQLMSSQERTRVKGILINKFRGDLSLFEDGKKWIEDYTGIKVIGIIPYMNDMPIEGEDSLSLSSRFSIKTRKEVEIVVIKLPYISNYTDIEPFLEETDVSIRFVDDPEQFGNPDAVIIPGTRSTIADLAFIKSRKLDAELQRYVKDGGRVVGICGGYQMLCETLIDEAGSDTGTPKKVMKGLSIVPMHTTFYEHKKTIRAAGTIHPQTNFIKNELVGYEIHLGKTEPIAGENITPFLLLEEGEEGICSHNGKVIGTYFHGLFHNDEWRTQWLNMIRKEKGLREQEVKQLENCKQQNFEMLADHVQNVVDLEYIIKVLNEWKRGL
ncbi:cobyric acid synthase [Bacillus taeanensis]|uniref:Cobyric acid synthase n=1 Tax=Bacillus taeanensis TaxID=273032 RepID=A0A366XWQ2_9BACI|nr:cobyric acid synthase [Bacillus taeanensis]RBW70327.1 cobyric acid synthase CobQ [Bacillus taeanensis]